MSNWFSLLFYQVFNDMRSRFLGSILGILWVILSPLLQVLMYVFLFGFIFKIRFNQGDSSIEYVLFILSTMVGWLAFQEGINSASTSIVRNSSIIKNVVFPTEIFPLAAILGSIVTFGVCLIIYIVLCIIGRHYLGLNLLFLPFILFTQILLMIGCGFLISTIGAFLKDVQAFLPTIMQLLLVGTPIFYEYKDLPLILQKITIFNPLYYIFDGYRAILFYNTTPNMTYTFIVLILSSIFTFSSYKLFRNFKGNFEAFI